MWSSGRSFISESLLTRLGEIAEMLCRISLTIREVNDLFPSGRSATLELLMARIIKVGAGDADASSGPRREESRWRECFLRLKSSTTFPNP